MAATPLTDTTPILPKPLAALGAALVPGVVWATEVKRLMLMLSRREREVLALSYFDGLSRAEIAVRMNLSVPTIDSNASRGLQRLAALLEGNSQL